MNPPLGSEERRQTQTIRKESDAAAPFEFSILAVDDSPVYRKLVQQSLQQEQCTVLPKSLKPIAASLTICGGDISIVENAGTLLFWYDSTKNGH